MGSPINDGLPNQAHFVSSSITRNENESDDDYATRVRAGSSAFMGYQRKNSAHNKYQYKGKELQGELGAIQR